MSRRSVRTVDGEIISLERSEVTDSKGRVLTVRYEAEVVTGELGRRLELAQAAAIRDVLAYLADKDRESQDDAERDSTS